MVESETLWDAWGQGMTNENQQDTENRTQGALQLACNLNYLIKGAEPPLLNKQTYKLS